MQCLVALVFLKIARSKCRGTIRLESNVVEDKNILKARGADVLNKAPCWKYQGALSTLAIVFAHMSAACYRKLALI